MSNPWLKKNPFMSMWLSGANSVANTARVLIAAEAKRQTTAARRKAIGDIFAVGLRSSKPATSKKRKKNRFRGG